MRRAWIIILVMVLAVARMHAGEAGKIVSQPEEARSTFGVSFEESWLKEYDGNKNPYSYLSSMLSLDCEPWKPFVVLGQPIRWQWRSTFVADAIMGGPETVYLGWAPQVRWMATIGRSPFSLYAGGGAGPGWANAKTANVNDGGLGQPFTFIILASWGVRYEIDRHWSTWLGMQYQHLSNAGMSDGDKPNTGLDSLGVMVGAGFGF
jgi:opacity protein-like surface antigen